MTCPSRLANYLWLTTLIPWLAGLATAAQPALDPNSPSRAQRSNPVTYDVDFSVVVTAPCKTELLRVWLPLPQSNEAQEITGRRLGSFPMGVEPKIAREPVHGNEFAYFEFKKPEGAQMLRHQFKARVFEERWNLEPANVETVERWPDAFAANLRPQADAAANSQFKEVLGELVPKRQGPANDLFSVMSWVDREMKYDHVNCSLRADAHFAFTNRQGHCSDYHGLCATMARSLGYPTRVVYGINLFPKNSPSHCKLEAYLPPYGWVSFDVSETQRLVQAIQSDKTLAADKRDALIAAARNRFRQGFRDNTWLLVTKGTDYNLAPPASKPVPVVRTIYAEADGMPLKDPDPANPKQVEHAWMTVQDFKADKKVSYPFKDLKSLETIPPNTALPKTASPKTASPKTASPKTAS